MNQLFSTLVILIFCISVVKSNTDELNPELSDPEIFQVNRAPARCTSQTYATIEQALKADRESSKYFKPASLPLAIVTSPSNVFASAEETLTGRA